MPGFNLDIGANTFEISKSLGALQADLARFRASLKTATNAQDIVKLNQAIKATETQIKNLVSAGSINSLKSLSAGFKDVVPGANSAGFALTNVGRVAQDLPFGFIGIQNNLNPLLESFQRLKQETGSGSAALKALGSSLIGPGGIGLALSVVSSIILIASNGIQGFGRSAGKTKEQTDRLKESIKELAQIEGQAVAGTQGQIAQVNALADSIGNTNLTYDQRKRALQELKSVNKAYFDDLKLEDAATGRLASTIAEYTNALIATAITKKFTEEIANVAKAASDAELEYDKLKSKRESANATLLAAQEKTNALLALGKTKGKEYQDALTALTVATGRATAAGVDARAADEGVVKLLEQKAVLTARLNKAVEDGLKFKSLENTGSGQEIDLLKKRLEQLEKIKDSLRDITTITGIEEQIFDLKVKITLRDAAKNGLSKEEVDLAIAGFRQELNEAFLREALAFEAIAKVKPTFILDKVKVDEEVNSAIAKGTGNEKKIKVKSEFEIDVLLRGLKFAVDARDLKKRLDELVNELKNLIEGSLQGLAGSIGEGIGNLFSTGDLSSVLKPFLSFLGDALIQLGKFAVKAGIQMKVLKESFTKFLVANPIAAIAIGITTIALGTALKNAFSNQKIPGFQGGFQNFRGGLAKVGENGPEILNLPQGTDIIPNSRLNQFFNQSETRTSVEVVPIIDAQGLAVLVRTGERKLNRNF